MKDRNIQGNQGIYFLLLIFIMIILYSINDMSTSTNSYQGQGNRIMVYVFLIGILALLGLYMLFDVASTGKLCMITPLPTVMRITLWVAIDNMMVSQEIWPSLTHIGLSFWWLFTIYFGFQFFNGRPKVINLFKVIVAAMFLYYCYQFIYVAIVSNRKYDEVTVLNLIYRVLVFVPYVFFINNKQLKTLVLSLIFAMTFTSMKRGAIIALPLMLSVAGAIQNRRDGIKLFVKLMLIVAVVILAFYVADQFSGGFVSYRFSLESLLNGSSRSDKYAAAWIEISGRDFMTFMLGIGSGYRAGVHNEWLEYLYTFGLVGLLLHIGFIWCLMKRLWQLCKERSKYAPQYGSAVTYILLLDMYSGFYFAHSSFYIMLFLGITERLIANERMNLSIHNEGGEISAFILG